MSYDSYNDDTLAEEKSFALSEDADEEFDEPSEPVEGAPDLGLEEDDDDPEDSFH